MDIESAEGFKPVRRRKGGRTRPSASPYDKDDAPMGAADGDAGDVLQAVDVEMNVADDEEEDDDKQGESDPKYAPLKPQQMTSKKGGGKFQIRRLLVPPHRYTPLRNAWLEMLQPLVDHMKLQVRMNTKRRCVEIRTSPDTKDIGALQKGADFVKAFLLGFEVQDAIALLRLDDLFIESFEIKDVKRLSGHHMSRAIGRISGKDGKTKYAVENATRTRIVLADQKIHILGSFNNIKLARDSICNLILGSPPGKVYNHLRTVAKRLQERL
ncbi:unnamed protein product [Vitrella brassicaformis CCMP3155]|uniref:K Homology domain-containing protein n=2 Tax=Vitrella brassicaformis TaxID=1169539 RepID=A0A0G4GKK1_VITBC|nr:unnamed protein product [Vitrella brassicaformis CCMP3155]|eukprot:CEM30549.1 unnamed protein product [Vitrella brassicaformis CCMP3155]